MNLLSVKLDISGTGNIKLLNVPEVKLPTGMEKYDPQVKEDITRKNIVSGKKEIEYLIVPRIAGTKQFRRLNFLILILTKNLMKHFLHLNIK